MYGMISMHLNDNTALLVPRRHKSKRNVLQPLHWRVYVRCFHQGRKSVQLNDHLSKAARLGHLRRHFVAGHLVVRGGSQPQMAVGQTPLVAAAVIHCSREEACFPSVGRWLLARHCISRQLALFMVSFNWRPWYCWLEKFTFIVGLQEWWMSFMLHPRYIHDHSWSDLFLWFILTSCHF